MTSLEDREKEYWGFNSEALRNSKATVRNLGTYNSIFSDTVEVSLREAIKPRMKILDLGCGKGFSVYDIAREYHDKGVKVVGADIVDNFATEGEYFRDSQLWWYKHEDDPVVPREERKARKFVVKTIEEFSDNSFDMIISVQVLSYLTNKMAMLSEIMRVLKPGGLCFLATEVDEIIKSSIITNDIAESESDEEIPDMTLVGKSVYKILHKGYDREAKLYTTKTFLETYFKGVKVKCADNYPAYVIKKGRRFRQKKKLPEYVSFVSRRQTNTNLHMAVTIAKPA